MCGQYRGEDIGHALEAPGQTQTKEKAIPWSVFKPLFHSKDIPFEDRLVWTEKTNNLKDLYLC